MRRRGGRFSWWVKATCYANWVDAENGGESVGKDLLVANGDHEASDTTAHGLVKKTTKRPIVLCRKPSEEKFACVLA